MARSGKGRLGGLGALFFLGTLGAIAFYVQGQSVPHERDELRKAATITPEEPLTEKPVVLPWRDRLDLSAAVLVPIQRPQEPAAAPSPNSAAPAIPSPPPPPTPEPTHVDPANAGFVQDLNDGHRILLTLDPVLQDAALTIFRNREVPYAGAVMLDLRDGAVLLLAGHSSMDPEVAPLEIVASAWAPAASTFKLVTAAALLEEPGVTPATKACFHGGLHGIEDDELRDDPSRDTRCENLSDAVAHSYNLVIAKLAQRHLEQQELADMARSLLFETEIPFEFNIERSPAHIPTSPQERAKVAAGFWNVDMSPFHGAVLASVFARDGLYQPPHIVAQVLGPDGSDLTPPRPRSTRMVNQEVAAAVHTMMHETTRIGTARKSFRDDGGNSYIPGMEVAGKTGSLTGKREPYLNYNWFIGFAPAERPEIAFAVLLANEPKWRIKAHYAARRLVQIYLERREAIARAADLRITPAGLVLPARDASGAIVRGAPPTLPVLPPPPLPEATPTAVDAAAPDNALPPLPPPPGALPKPQAAPS